jgi:glycogen operon protein
MANEHRRGKSFPLGATPTCGGVNFSVFSKNCTNVELLLFDTIHDLKPARTISLDPKRNKTSHYWHVFVPGLEVGQPYGYRVHGRFDPANGHRFDGDKVLLDPYAKCVSAADYDRPAARRTGDNCAHAMKSIVAESRKYDWEGDAPFNRPFSQTVIYEMHVGGFTRHFNSGVAAEKRGTFAGVIEKIPYLLQLGITAVELLPVFQFDPQDAPPTLSNYWGYCPISFFAPHSGYSSRKDPLGCLDEFRDMVKALHRAGIEIILDVVYNHTAEGPEDGPTLCFRGFDNSVYYLPRGNDKSRYANYTGCGNTLNANHSVVRRMILDSVHYWASVMHVDGFRFDLASILSRDETGRPLANAPILSDLESDPVLAGAKLIAEAWDTELYQVGNFAGGNWKEWNGLFRDQVRAFVKGDRGTVRGLADRTLGSPDLYFRGDRTAEQSINFVTCHDGFTLNDLISYNTKHNEANLEQNRDGTDNNLGWNCGIEGLATNPEVEELRNRQVKNFLAILLLSAGTPMIAMGDEVRRTQRGNNNAYCQDNETSWFDWRLLDQHADIFRFVQQLIRLRLAFERGREMEALSLTELLRQAELRWHGVEPGQPDWGDDSHTLSFTLKGFRDGQLRHVIMNAYWERIEFRLPSLPGGDMQRWRLLMDTSLPSPLDINELSRAPSIESAKYFVTPRSLVILTS